MHAVRLCLAVPASAEAAVLCRRPIVLLMFIHLLSSTVRRRPEQRRAAGGHDGGAGEQAPLVHAVRCYAYICVPELEMRKLIMYLLTYNNT